MKSGCAAAGFAMLVCAIAAPVGASSGVPDADPPAWVAHVGVGGTGLGIKAKTDEGLGPVGEKRAIAAHAVALVELPD